MRNQDQARPIARASNLRWFFLAWVGIIFLWELLTSFHLLLVMLAPPACNQPLNTANLTPLQMQKLKMSCSSSFLAQNSFNAPLVVLFVGLAILHVFLHWLALSKRLSRRLIWVYISAQVCLIVLLGIVAQQTLDSTTLVFSLSLVLLLEIIGFFQQTQTPALIIGSFIFLLLLVCLWQIWTGGATDPLSFIVNWQTSTIPLFLPFVTGFLLLYLAQFQARRRAEQTHQELAQTHQQLQQAATRIEELTLLTERQRMARELHDTLAQSLAGLIRQLDIVDLHLTREQPEQARALVQESSATARGALTEARSAIDNLRARHGMLDDLTNGVAAEAEHFKTTTGISCATQLDALASASPALVEPIIRIVGEGLVNIARHAQARRAWITSSQDDGELLLEIGDDGVGFAFPESAYQPGHYGLVGLSERARLLGGDMEVVSTIGHGTVLRFHIPLERSKMLV